MSAQPPGTLVARDRLQSGMLTTTIATKKRWRVRATRAALEEAEAYAWARLTRSGGEYRVRQDRRVLARGAGYANRWSPTERTAVWGRMGDRDGNEMSP